MSDRTNSHANQQATQRDEIAVIVSTIDRQERKYADILPSNVSWSDFRNAFLIAVQMNPRLLDADRQSLWLSLQKAASDGLKPDGREGALVIFGDDQEDDDGNPVPSTAKGKKKVVWMPMIAGLIKLVRNTGNVSNIRAKLIYKGEEVIVSDEDGKESYKHIRTIREGSTIDDSPENIIGAFAVVNYKDGGWEIEPITRRQIDRIRAISRAKNGPWKTFYDEMAKKTVLRRLIKRLDKSAELRLLDSAMQADETLGIEIDGEKPSEIMGEFSAEKQSAIPQQAQQAAERQHEHAPEGDEQAKTERLKAEQAGLRAAAAEKMKPAPESAKADVKPDVKEEVMLKPAAEAEQPGFDHFALDEITGEPIDGRDGHPLYFKNAGSFALWYVERYKASSNPDALQENNADALEEIRQHKSASLILDTLKADAAEPKADAVKEAPTPKPAAVDPNVVLMPLLPNNKLNLPKYCLAVGEALKKVKTGAEMEAWIASNAEIMSQVPLGGAYGMKLEGLLKAQRAKQAPADESPKTPTVDMDEQRVMDLKTELDAITTEHEYDGIIRRETTKALARRLTAERPELRKIIADADTAAFRRVKTRPVAKAPAADPPPDDNMQHFNDEIPWARGDEPPSQEHEGE